MVTLTKSKIKESAVVLAVRPWTFVFGVLTWLPAAVWGHVPLHGVGTVSQIVFHEDRILVTFDLSYDGFWAQAEMIHMDADKNSSVEKDEADGYLEERWKKKIAPNIRALVNGQEAEIRRLGARHENLVGEIYGVPFSLYYELEIRYPARNAPPGEWSEFEFHDAVIKGEIEAQPQYFIPYDGHGTDKKLRCRIDFPPMPVPALEPKYWVIANSRLIARFLFEPANDFEVANRPKPPATADTVPPPTPAPRPGASGVEKKDVEDRPLLDDSKYSSNLEKAVRGYRDLSWDAMIGLLFLAVLWGAGHAMTPGHGKSMVAAYLIGSRGRVRDAVILGVVTTITHTGSVFLFGGGVYLIMNATTQYSTGHLQSLVIVGTQIFSGLLLAFMGTILFFRRLRGVEPGHSHHHDHGAGHSHQHGHDDSHSRGHGHTHAHGDSDEHTHAHTTHDVPHGHHDHQHDNSQGDPPMPSSKGTAFEHGTGESSRGLLEGGTPRLWDLIALGFSGGLVPCPAGLTVILIGLQYVEHLAFTLLLLVFFSIGLGGVLIAIGVLLISGKALARNRGSRDGRFFQEIQFLQRLLPTTTLAKMDRLGIRVLKVTPPLSCLFMAGLGVFFIVKTYMDGKTEIIAMLRMLADWMDPTT